MTEKRTILEPCPCGNGVLQIGASFMDDLVEIRCHKCGRTTGERENKAEAIWAWNAQTGQEMDS